MQVVFLLLALAVAVVVVMIVAGLIQDGLEHRHTRRAAARRSLEAEWHIQQIASEARAQMWEAAQRQDYPR